MARESNTRAAYPRTPKVVSLGGTKAKAKAMARTFPKKDPNDVVASLGTVARMVTWSGIVCAHAVNTVAGTKLHRSGLSHRSTRAWVDDVNAGVCPRRWKPRSCNESCQPSR